MWVFFFSFSTHRATRRDVPGSLSPGDFDWGRLSNEFRQLLLQGALEPKEVHVKYHREFRKVRG